MWSEDNIKGKKKELYFVLIEYNKKIVNNRSLKCKLLHNNYMYLNSLVKVESRKMLHWLISSTVFCSPDLPIPV